MRRKVTCRDAGDGSGDVILELPEELLQAASLAVGDTLELERDPSDSASIRLKKSCSATYTMLERSRLDMASCRRSGTMVRSRG